MFNLGSETKVAVNGKVYTLSRWEVDMSHEFGRWIAERVGNPFAHLKDLLPYLDAKAAQDERDRAAATMEQLQSFSMTCPLAKRFLATEIGLAEFFRIWLSRNHPDITLNEAFSVAQALSPEQIARAMGQANGELPPNLSAPQAAGTG